jgi:perosamine synthetase
VAAPEHPGAEIASPQNRPVQLATPAIKRADRRRVWKALKSPQIAYGPTVDEFEAGIAERVARHEGVATISGTAALHLALLAVGVRPEDLVLVPSLTFVAPANAARYVGATPFLFDAEPEYRQLDVDRLSEWLHEECEITAKGTVHRASATRIGAIVPVDLLGHPCDVPRLAKLTESFRLPIVEDGAQAFGATHEGRPLGTGADVLCLSFNANKIITTAGGGMLLSDDKDLIEKVRCLANQAKAKGKEYVHPEIGFNYRMPSAQAALGLGQLSRLDDILERKEQIARRYEASLSGTPGLTMPRVSPTATATNWLFTVDVDGDEFGRDSKELREALEDEDIETRPIFAPLHERGAHQGLQAHECHVAERLAAAGLSLPSSVTLGNREIDRVCEIIHGLHR